MKSSGRERRPGRGAKCLIVDGYNVIARMKRSSLEAVADLEAMRDNLADRLSQYGAFYGEHVMIVFDAHQTPGEGAEFVRSGVRILYTFKNETADERIERLVYELRDVYQEIKVATSDRAEQQVIFGGGALRMSADELLRKMSDTERQITSRADETKHPQKNRIGDSIRQDVANILEKWRRQ